MLQCGGNGWREFTEMGSVADYRFLAKTAGLGNLIFSSYIVFLTKLQKEANPLKWICPLEKRYHRFWPHCQHDGYIAKSKGFELMVLNRNRKYFIASIFPGSRHLNKHLCLFGIERVFTALFL